MMKQRVVSMLVVAMAAGLGCGDGAGGVSDAGNGNDADADADSDGDSDGDTPAHDICEDIGDTFGMGAAIFGDTGTSWVLDAAGAPDNVDWTYGYMYASGDPHEDLEGFEWIVGSRLDTALEMGARLPTVTFYRMLNVGEAHGYAGNEAQIVQQMLLDGVAVRDYLDDFVSLLRVLDARLEPTLIHVEPDSWGFMMWAFDGVDGVNGNPDASFVPVDLSGAAHPSLVGQVFSDDAGGLGRAMLFLRDLHAPEARMGWHASNFRVGTRPEVVTGFYSSMGAWDVIVTEPPHMVDDGTAPWDGALEDNAANLAWLEAVSIAANLPILIWQTYVDDAAAYLGAWPTDQGNLAALGERGVAGVMWDPQGDGCGYACQEANDLLGFLGAYCAAPLSLPATHVCNR